MQKGEYPSRHYERWIWIELIGFDNTRPGVGVHDYVEKLGFIPEAMSFLLTSPDIIHQHSDINSVIDLSPDVCSYYGNAQNPERERQVWTNHQLRELVETLHYYGIQTFLSTFTTFLDNQFHSEWLANHTELFEARRSGGHHASILALKRLKDGSYYEDYLIPKLCQTLTDYGFDGWHAADGWGPARMPLSESDYSDDMFDQFVRAKAIAVPESITYQCDGEHATFAARADWVWQQHRRAWIDFYSDRWAAFYQKKVAALHAIGKQIVINSSWTRDPFILPDIKTYSTSIIDTAANSSLAIFNIHLRLPIFESGC